MSTKCSWRTHCTHTIGVFLYEPKKIEYLSGIDQFVIATFLLGVNDDIIFMNYLKVANFFLIFILYTSKIIRTKKENYKNKQKIIGV